MEKSATTVTAKEKQVDQVSLSGNQDHQGQDHQGQDNNGQARSAESGELPPSVHKHPQESNIAAATREADDRTCEKRGQEGALENEGLLGKEAEGRQEAET